MLRTNTFTVKLCEICLFQMQNAEQKNEVFWYESNIHTALSINGTYIVNSLIFHHERFIFYRQWPTSEPRASPLTKMEDRNVNTLITGEGRADINKIQQFKAQIQD